MSTITVIATSGLRAAGAAMRASAHNLANLQAEWYRRERVVHTPQSDGGVMAFEWASQKLTNLSRNFNWSTDGPCGCSGHESHPSEEVAADEVDRTVEPRNREKHRKRPAYPS